MMSFYSLMSSNKVSKENLNKYLGYFAVYLNSKNALDVFLWMRNFSIDFDIVLKYLNDENKPIRYNYVIQRLISYGRKDLVLKYFDYFINDNSELLALKKILKDNNMDISRVNNCIETHLEKVYMEMLSNAFVSNLKAKEEKLYDFLVAIVNDLLRSEKKEITDVELMTRGSFSSVYSIGSKVLKLGKKRKTFHIKNNRRFLKPLYRKDIYSLTDNKFLMCVEITEKVDVANVTADDVQFLYNELRREGLVWADPKKNNIGRLLKDNKIYFDNVNDVALLSTGYLDSNNEVLKKGDLVICDNDYIYEASTFFSSSDYNAFLMNSEYEKKYQEGLEKDAYNQRKI